jgi:hypothetical protein
MSKWMSKSVATIHGTGGEEIKLDDYMMKNAHLIIGRIANRFDPGAWNKDGTKWKSAEDLAGDVETGKETGKETSNNLGETADSGPRDT